MAKDYGDTSIKTLDPRGSAPKPPRPTPEENGTTQPLLIAHEKNGTNHSPPDPRQPKNNREQTTKSARASTTRGPTRGVSR